MNTTITFNSKTNPYAVPDAKDNLMFILIQERYFNDILKARGYIYLNTIYEMLGVKWDTDWDNLCLKYRPGVELKLAIRGANEDGFDIDIL